MFMTVVVILQLGLSGIMAYYFYKQIKTQQAAKPAMADNSKEAEKLRKMRAIHLSEPLNEKVRPQSFDDIVGQKPGVRALKAILCGPNPQHVIIYGPPGVGKTCAARLSLEEAKGKPGSPFSFSAPFIEMDATCVRFDERAIADPLIGSVHDPIYQGAGPLGMNGVPQPKQGAVSRAHGGVLFLDEIGELHPIQMNKLLKVLEDRKVSFESAYYNENDRGTPAYIHEIFKNGIPADFRLVGATTRSPQELPAALRSRCMEVFFDALGQEDMKFIAENAANKAGYSLEPGCSALISRYSGSGRDAVNIVQMASGIALTENRSTITCADVSWVADCCHYTAHADAKVSGDASVGFVNGLAVHGGHLGSIISIHAKRVSGTGRIMATGIIDEEELGHEGHKMRRRSTASGAVDCVTTALKARGINFDGYDVHINFPGGAPVDGPSAGVAMAVAVWSAMTGIKIDSSIAMTGEISVGGDVHAVGGIPAKVEAARRAGCTKVLIPIDNMAGMASRPGLEIIPIATLDEAISAIEDQTVQNPAQAVEIRAANSANSGIQSIQGS